jgi:hypothetical protein
MHEAVDAIHPARVIKACLFNVRSHSLRYLSDTVSTDSKMKVERDKARQEIKERRNATGEGRFCLLPLVTTDTTPVQNAHPNAEIAYPAPGPGKSSE